MSTFQFQQEDAAVGDEDEDEDDKSDWSFMHLDTFHVDDDS